jgi:hypothetical protein
MVYLLLSARGSRHGGSANPIIARLTHSEHSQVGLRGVFRSEHKG